MRDSVCCVAVGFLGKHKRFSNEGRHWEGESKGGPSSARISQNEEERGEECIKPKKRSASRQFKHFPEAGNALVLLNREETEMTCGEGLIIAGVSEGRQRILRKKKRGSAGTRSRSTSRCS